MKMDQRVETLLGELGVERAVRALQRELGRPEPLTYDELQRMKLFAEIQNIEEATRRHRLENNRVAREQVEGEAAIWRGWGTGRP